MREHARLEESEGKGEVDALGGAHNHSRSPRLSIDEAYGHLIF
ncbi:uncharacterized protein G2W53_030427 [Senna tora]|uniref:Uncharacterized protein n=1 Tax=Senna tora TaxID=362788 RepID=A0A834T5T0_9FABA|nr:uncharacterized protein G2W53_030427 [Senna tora]